MLIIDLMRDNNSADCGRIVDWTNRLIMGGNKTMISILPDTFEEYWSKTIDGKARTEYRKAVKSGISLEQITNTGKIGEDLYGIQHSTEIRQGRPLTPKYYGKKWEPIDFTRFKCSRHYEEFYIARKEDRPVSYLWIVVCGEYITANSIMGHVDYWKYGIMKYMIIEAMKRKIEESGRIVRYFAYGWQSFNRTKLKYFCREMGLNCPERSVVNG